MSHPFGDLLSQIIHRKHGLSQFKLADGILQTPSIISEMCKGKRLTGLHARERVVAIAGWLCDQGALTSLVDANALLEAAGMSPLAQRDIIESRLLDELREKTEQSPSQLKGSRSALSPSVKSGRQGTTAPTRHNLPAQFTHFVGRVEQIAQLEQQVRTQRLITLTGAGGVGKTRLALEVAARAMDAFADGAWFVNLAPISDPALLPQCLMEVLHMPEQPGQSREAALITFLNTKKLLLILDNCEHLIQAVAGLTEQMLQACPQVHLLTTSREALHVSAEISWQVPSLTRPPLKIAVQNPGAYAPRPAAMAEGEHSGTDDLRQFEAVRLFIDRVLSYQPAFTLSTANAWAVAHICSRLDGIPLALEMAAAWITVLTVEEIAARLSGAFDARFQMLTSASRTVSHRQQTLRATMEWSYALLTLPEQRLLQRLPVFADSWTAEAAERVCADPGSEGILTGDVLPLLAGLIQKSLLIAEQRGGQTRYRMLETIRQFAVEKFAGADELPSMRDHHLAYFLDMAEEPPLEMLAGPSLTEKMNRLHQERDNLRSALEWAHRKTDGGESALRLAGALWLFWYNNGYHGEGLTWLRETLANGESASTAARGKALVALADFMWGVDTERMAYFAGQGLALCRQANYLFGIAYALVLLGETAHRHGDDRGSQAFFEESLQVSRASGSPEALWNAYFLSGWLLLDHGELQRASENFEACVALAIAWKDTIYTFHPLVRLSAANPIRALTLCQAELARQRQVDDPQGLAVILLALGIVLLDVGNTTEASAALTESLALWTKLGLQWHWVGGTGRAHLALGRAAWLRDDHETAISHFEESLRQFREVSDNQLITQVLPHLGYAALAQGRPDYAAACFMESLRLLEKLRGLRNLSLMLAGLAEVMNVRGNPLLAARLFGAAQSYGEAWQYSITPSERIGYNRLVASEQARLGDPALAAAYAAGRTMSFDDVMQCALGTDPVVSP